MLPAELGPCRTRYSKNRVAIEAMQQQSDERGKAQLAPLLRTRELCWIRIQTLQHAASRLAAAGSCAMVRDAEGRQCCLRGRAKSILTDAGWTDAGLRLTV